jgi:hypothetical protein
MSSLKVKRTQNEHVDEGEYKAIVTNIEKRKGGRGDFFIWSFLVKDATNEGEALEGKITVTGLTSERFSEKSVLYKWARG